MDVVAMVALAGSVEEEAPRLAADLALTTYEAAMMLRAPPPIVVLRTEDRARTTALLGTLRARGHGAIACDLAAVTASDDMFQPKGFRFDGGELVGVARGEERRLALREVAALVRANHVTRTEDTVVEKTRGVGFGRAVLTGGMVTTKTTTTERKRVTNEHEPVLYVFSEDAAPWLLVSTRMHYDGLGADMRIARAENFDVVVERLREHTPPGVFDARLLALRPSTTIVAAGAKHLSTSTVATVDVLAHLVAIALRRTSRPYR